MPPQALQMEYALHAQRLTECCLLLTPFDWSQAMDALGRILSEPAPDKSVRKQASRLEYKRSLPSSSILIDVSPNEKITLVSEVSVNSGFLTFSQGSEDQVIKTCRTYGAKFQAHTLEKVNNDEDGDIFNFEEIFYPVLHKMLNNKQDWTT